MVRFVTWTKSHDPRLVVHLAQVQMQHRHDVTNAVIGVVVDRRETTHTGFAQIFHVVLWHARKVEGLQYVRQPFLEAGIKIAAHRFGIGADCQSVT
jgi:hypothetical protein